MPYIGRGSDFGVRSVFHFLASNGDTSVSGADADGKNLNFTDGNFIDVYLNGVRLKSGEDYNTATANTVAGLSALNANDEVNIVVYDTFTVADTVKASEGGTFGGDVTTTGTFNVTGDTAAGDDASIGFTSAEGLILTGQGTTNDVTIKNDADTAVIQIPTGTDDVNFTDDISLKSDGAVMNFGADSEITVTHVADTGLNIKHTATGDDKPIKITLQTGETDIAADDVLGAIDFQAPDEGTGTDAILVAAGIQAVSEGDFSSSSNATSLVFKTGASEAATEQMRINSAGRVGIGTTDIDAALDIVDSVEYVRIASSTSDDTTKTGGLAVRHRDNEEEDFNIINGVSGSSSNIVNIGGSDFIGNLNAATNISFFTAANRTTVNGTQRMTMDSSGRLLIGNTTYDSTSTGVLLNGASGKGFFTVSGDAPLLVNRLSSDGDLVELQQASNTEGKISVLGSTVSYEGFSGLHESSGIATDTPIGTVVSTIDELDIYSAKQNGIDGEEVDSPKAGETRADHAKVEISSTVGDSAVYGVVAKFNTQGKVMVTSVGIGSVRVTGACAKGDLLESNGDGTAKVQSDDIVRSKTLGKVTIGNSITDEKLVSCVLYCG